MYKRQDGPTHHGCEDAAYLSQIPGMTVLSPGSFVQLDNMLQEAILMDGPVAVRYPRGKEGRALSPWKGEHAVVPVSYTHLLCLIGLKILLEHLGMLG